MRKKAHIKLASLLVDTIDDFDLKKHKFWCEVGSILPDIVPTFLWKRHRIDTTNKEFEKAVYKFFNGKQIGRLYCIRAGIISHYLSDYFTFPHNKEYTLGFKYHNIYEGKQLSKIREVYSDDVLIEDEMDGNIKTIDSLFDFIQRIHKEYLERVVSVPDWLNIDLDYIMFINLLVFHTLVQNRDIILQYLSLDDYQMVGAY